MGLESGDCVPGGAGHDAIALELPGDDETAGLPRYTEIVVNAIGSHADVVLVAGSLGGLTTRLVQILALDAQAHHAALDAQPALAFNLLARADDAAALAPTAVPERERHDKRQAVSLLIGANAGR